MLVQALAAYADTYLREQLADPAFEQKPVPYAVELYDDGSFAGVRQRFRETTRGKKTVLSPLPLSVPKSPVARNAGLHPLLGCDGIQYVLGPKVGAWTEQKREKNHLDRHTAFVQLIEHAAEQTNDPALRACASFYADQRQVEAARCSLAELKAAGSALVALAVVPRDAAAESPGGPVCERPAVREHWREHYDRAFADRVAAGGQGRCLVSGKLGPIAPKHELIKRLGALGGQPAGVALMSFDKPAFGSYGWTDNANSPVSPDRAAAYVLALNDLLRSGSHRRGASPDKVVRTRFDCGGVGFLFWTREPTDDDWLALLNEPQPEQVAALLRAPLAGSLPTELDPNDFYLAAVSGNGGRLVVRDWFYDKLTKVIDNVRGWFEALCIADVFRGGDPSEPPKLFNLLLAISSAPRASADKVKKVPPDRIMRLMRRALYGTPLGRTILAAALGRLRVEQGEWRLQPERIGLVRLCVNDLAKKGESVMTEQLDSTLEHPAYVCGRLLATYEQLQYISQGGVNVTVVDRYYALASTNPQLAFPRIEELGIRHLKKLRRDKAGAAVNIQRQLQDLHEVLARSGGVFPGQLSLEDQGRFAIGFHHEKAEQARRSREAKARRKADDTTPEDIAEPQQQ